jgi:phosphopantothenoylcysteine decarboxylase/phosphopantothenate--cysteine ligase
MCAAVADFTPLAPENEKTKRGKANWSIELQPTKDIAASLGKQKRANQLLVGFALETNNELENAQGKLAKKNLDFIVLNSLKDKGAGFGVDTNKITIVDKNNNRTIFELKPKAEVAKDIVAKMAEHLC